NGRRMSRGRQNPGRQCGREVDGMAIIRPSFRGGGGCGPPLEAGTLHEVNRPSRPFVVLLLLSVLLLLYVAFPFRTPLFLAVVLAAVLHKPLERLTVLLKGRRTIASAIVTLGVQVVIVAPFASLVIFVSRESMP